MGAQSKHVCVRRADCRGGSDVKRKATGATCDDEDCGRKAYSAKLTTGVFYHGDVSLYVAMENTQGAICDNFVQRTEFMVQRRMW